MRPRPVHVLVLALAAQAAVSLVNFGLPAISHEIQGRIDVGVAGFGTIYAMVGIGATATLIPAGVLVDRLGSRVVLMAGAVLVAAGDTIAAFAGSAVPFGAGMFLAGMGSAAAPVAGMTALLAAFPPERGGVVLGWRQLAVPLGGLVAALALPLLAHAGGVPLALVTVAAATLVTSAAFAAVAGSERAAARSLRLDGVLRIPGMPSLLWIGALYGAALGVVLTYIVPAARDAGMSGGEAGAVFVTVNVAAGLARIAWGRAADRVGGSRRVTTLLQTGVLATSAALLVPPALDAGVATAVLAAAILAFGIFGFNAVLYLAAGEWAGPHRAGRAVGVATTVVFGSSALSAPVAGVAVERFGFGAMWVLTAVLAGIGTGVAWRLRRTRRAARAAGLPIPDAETPASAARARPAASRCS